MISIILFGLILGSKKNNIYYISDAIYGFIFEGEEDPKTNKKELMKISDESLQSLFNSLKQKFKMNNPNISLNKNNKEKEIKFRSNDSLIILGGFVTDKQPFGQLYRFYSTIDKVNNESFPNINKILLMVDPSYQDNNDVKFGIKAYEWGNKNIKIQNLEKSNNFMIFKELESEIVQHINNFGILSGIKNKNLWEKIFNLKIEKGEKKNISELLLDLKDGNDNIFMNENNLDFIKNKIEESIGYMDIFQKFLENLECDNDDIVNGDDLNKIAYIIRFKIRRFARNACSLHAPVAVICDCVRNDAVISKLAYRVFCCFVLAFCCARNRRAAAFSLCYLVPLIAQFSIRRSFLLHLTLHFNICPDRELICCRNNHYHANRLCGNCRRICIYHIVRYNHCVCIFRRSFCPSVAIVFYCICNSAVIIA